MPLYEYECTLCHKHTEKIQKFSDTEITVCPHCGGMLERVLTAPAISFKGGGWYKDLYSSAKPANSGKGESSSGDSSSGDSSSGDSSSKESSKPAGDGGAAPPAAAPASTSNGAASTTASSTAAVAGKT